MDIKSLKKELRNLGIPVEGNCVRKSDVKKALAKWDNLPKGWTEDSARKFWKTLTGDRKHKRTACMKAMEGKVSNPGAFCQSLYSWLEK